MYITGKTCSRCKIDKAFSCFYFWPKGQRYSTYCNACHLEIKKIYRKGFNRLNEHLADAQIKSLKAQGTKNKGSPV